MQAVQEVYLHVEEVVARARQVFPDPQSADGEGFLASGGDLSPEMLVMAYSIGVFPWFDDHSPILWWSPDPRIIFYPGKIRVSKSLKQTLGSGKYTVTFDRAFTEVIEHCSRVKRQGQKGTWITAEMKEAYINLHKEGFAHSVEAWHGDTLAGGLYGVSIGTAFFGESMFHLMTDASKVAFAHLAKRLEEWGFRFIDGQVPNPHLNTLGAVKIDRIRFLAMLHEAIQEVTRLGSWS